MNPAVVTRYGAKPKQTRNEHGRKNKKQTNRESRQKEADVKVACKGHRHQEGTQNRKPSKLSKRLSRNIGSMDNRFPSVNNIGSAL